MVTYLPTDFTKLPAWDPTELLSDEEVEAILEEEQAEANALYGELVIRPSKHLPGQHDQLDHAPDGGGGGTGSGEEVPAIDVATKRGISGLGTLTTVESDATRSYRSIAGFRAINEYLRGIPNPRLSSSEREMIGDDARVFAEELIDMFDRPGLGYTVPNDIEVYRGAPFSVFGDLQPGDTIPDPGVISTAPTRDAANGFDTTDTEETLLVITVPGGEKVLPLDRFEILLKPGTEFEVLENDGEVVKLRVKS